MSFIRRTLPLALSAAGLSATFATAALAQPSSAADDSAPPADFAAGGARSELPSNTASAPELDTSPPVLLGRNLPIGGYGGIDPSYARLFGRDGALIGIEGAFSIDHRLSVGAAWYGSTNPLAAPDAPNGDGQHFLVEYGGLNLHYSFFVDRSPVYLTLGVLIGGGAVELSHDRDRGPFNDYGDVRQRDGFAILQHDVTLHANLTHWMRLGLSAGYRLVSGVSRNGFDNGDLNGFMLGGQAQFGSF